MASAAKNMSTGTGQQCKKCDQLDDDEMVQCDICDKWYHFLCVGVTETIASQDWMCGVCQDSKKEQMPAPPTSNRSTTSSERKRRMLELRKLEEERALFERREAEEKADREQRAATQARRDREYREKKYSFLADELSDEEQDCGPTKPTVAEVMRKTNEWLKHVPDFGKVFFADQPGIKSSPNQQSRQVDPPNLLSQRPNVTGCYNILRPAMSNPPGPSLPHRSEQRSAPPSNLLPQLSNAAGFSNIQRSVDYNPLAPSFHCGPEEISAHVMSRDLPTIHSIWNGTRGGIGSVLISVSYGCE